MNRTPLLTFSHLRWDSVFQRPHHIMTRLARRRPVLFVEEPVRSEGAPDLHIREVAPNLRVCTPHLRAGGPGFGSDQHAELLPALRSLLEEVGWTRFAAWLYTPMAVRMARALQPGAIVYDCMDELSAFRMAPPELIERERELLAHADTVFTGGPSLYRAKRDRHPFAHCFPSSVDARHFAKARRASDAPDQEDLPRPRLGYFGVIDERMDLALLDALATGRPRWQIVMVGPVVKIDLASLPKRPNLHYLGQRSYDELPHYLAGWDVCLMPFARNESTKFISPTKVLEYMAADRPIVSTPITDVVEPYGDIVYSGSDAATFVTACDRALSAPHAERRERQALARDVLSRTSWDRTVRAMGSILDTLLEREAVPAAARVAVRGVAA
ncbi:MAG TPA: glycosyltransferase family 1 protein [Candidatus Eisenbacteria bacterium]|nr:glycosyltransferase family 1 protein [Candidatus Eisenbacteria bacterium]